MYLGIKIILASKGLYHHHQINTYFDEKIEEILANLSLNHITLKVIVIYF